MLIETRRTRIPQSSPPRLINARRASFEFGFAYSTLRKIVREGRIPHLRIGKSIYLERADLHRWIREQKERAATATAASA